MNPSPMNPQSLLQMAFALVSVNLRMMVVRRNRVLWGLLFLGSFAPAVIARVIVGWYWDDLYMGEIADAYAVYSAMSATLYMQLYVPVLALMMGLTLISSEVENETLVYLLTRPVPRSLLAFGKFAAYLILASTLVVSSLGMTFLVLGSMPESDLWWFEWDILLQDSLVFVLGLAAYGAFFMWIGSLFRYRLIIGLLLLFVWDTSAALLPGSSYQFTIRHYLLSLFPHELEGGGELIELLTRERFSSEPWSIFMLLAICLVSIGLTALVLKWKQLPMGQGDA